MEKYIEECLMSIAKQTYQGQVECLLIDDCGQDDSMDIVHQFIKSYNGSITFRIIVHEHNRGLSAARNTGIRAAKGHYVLFVDSDDIVHPDCLTTMVDCLNENDLDMIVGSFEVVNGYRPYWSDIYKTKEFISFNSHEIISFFSNGHMYEMAWNKLIRRDILVNNNIYFKEGLILEDQLWTFHLVNYINSFQMVTKTTYYYQVRQDSIMNNKDFIKKRLENRVVVQEERNRLFKKHIVKHHTDLILRMRKDKNRLAYDILQCKDLSSFGKIIFLFRLSKLSGSHRFIYDLLKIIKRLYYNN